MNFAWAICVAKEDAAALAAQSDVMVDFSAPGALEGNLEAAIARIDKWSLACVICIGIGTVGGIFTGFMRYIKDCQLRVRRQEQASISNNEIVTLKNKAAKAENDLINSESKLKELGIMPTIF